MVKSFFWHSTLFFSVTLRLEMGALKYCNSTQGERLSESRTLYIPCTRPIIFTDIYPDKTNNGL